MTTREVSVVVVLTIAGLLLADAGMYIHPIDPSLWRGEHNNLGRWIAFRHIREAEVAASIAVILGLIGYWTVTGIRNRKRQKEMPQPPPPN